MKRRTKVTYIFVTIFISFHFFSLAQNSTFTQKYFSKTYGKISYDSVKGRIPPKGTVVNCIRKCYSTNGCSCVRISIESNKCDLFGSSHGDPNSLNATFNYIYYAIKGYRDTIGKENLAYNKKVTQSSTYNTFQGTNAVDKNRKTESKTSGSKGKSYNNVKYPWMQIDLNKQYIISGVMIMSNDVNSLHDIEIRVGNRPIMRGERGTHFKENALCAEHIGNGFIKNNASRTIVCEPCPINGRFVTVQIVRDCTNCTSSGYNVLNIAEIEIYGI